MTATLTPTLADKFATLALNHVQREFPNKLDHVMNDEADVRSPRALHPVFYGSFDWHSCVHGYWLLARMLRLHPEIASAPRIRALFDEQLTAEKIGGEAEYLRQPNRGTFERPYGWAWALMLGAELLRIKGDDGLRWSQSVMPLAAEFVARFVAFIPKATYPIRGGAHFNTPFAFTLALEYADTVGDITLARAVKERSVAWFGADAECQAWEPSGDDFLSPALMEATCMQRVLPPDEFRAWFARFLPRLMQKEPATLFTPATVSDRRDGKIGHLDGLNLSRAWCLRALARSIDDESLRSLLLATAEEHIAVSIPHVAGDYMGEHWLATFATLALG